MKKIIAIFIVLLLFLVSFDNGTYSRYVLTRNINTTVSSAPFYFNAQKETTTIHFPRTSSESDVDEILTTETPVKFKISNNDGTNFNNYQVTYQISVVNSNKFTLVGGDSVTKTIDGGSLKNEEVTVNLKIKDLTRTDDTVRIRVTSTFPYSKTFEFDYKVTQAGAIQYIEDLVDMSLAIRGTSNPNNLQVSDIQSQRFKMTRNLDFTDKSSYKNADNNAYGDINGNQIFGGSIFAELNSDTGFLPIGELKHPFKGVFNGGEHTISHLTIQKSLQINIGFFGTTEGATIKDLTFSNGDVTNHNQTAGMVVGKVIGGTLENIVVDVGSVVSMDEDSMTEDTYTGGIAGYVTASATIKNCTNYASVTTKFVGDASQFSGPAGGITAWMSHSIIDGCKNYGEISGESYIGGIAGFSGMQLENDPNSVGGGTIQNCHNYGYVHYYSEGKIDSNWGKHVGGIAGYNKKDALITACTNESDARVVGLTNVGGIVGNNAGIITNNSNYSKNISGTSHHDYIYGFQSSTGSASGNHNYA